MEAEVRAQLDAENSWWVDTAGAPANLVSADSKADFKRLITEAPPTQLIVVDYLKPSCGACRRLYPKLQQVAAANPDALFLKVRLWLAAGAVGRKTRRLARRTGRSLLALCGSCTWLVLESSPCWLRTSAPAR